MSHIELDWVGHDFEWPFTMSGCCGGERASVFHANRSLHEGGMDMVERPENSLEKSAAQEAQVGA
jgi:hypothetical protein